MDLELDMDCEVYISYEQFSELWSVEHEKEVAELETKVLNMTGCFPNLNSTCQEEDTTNSSITDVTDNFDFSAYFNHLLNNKKCVDTTFILNTPEGEEKVFAHQLVLAMWSSYFADEFYSNQNNNKNKCIRLEHVNSKAFKDMIRYCYGCQPELGTTEEVCALFMVGKQFRVMSLVNLCQVCLSNREINPRNVFSILEVSEYLENDKLKIMCETFIGENTKEVVECYSFQDFTPEMVYTILNLPILSFNSEYELVVWLFEWAEVNCKQKDSGFKKARDCLNKLLQHINFLDLTFEEFALLCKDYPNFFTDDEIANIYLSVAFQELKTMPEGFSNSCRFRKNIGQILIEIAKTRKFMEIIVRKKGNRIKLLECLSAIHKNLRMHFKIFENKFDEIFYGKFGHNPLPIKHDILSEIRKIIRYVNEYPVLLIEHVKPFENNCFHIEHEVLGSVLNIVRFVGGFADEINRRLEEFENEVNQSSVTFKELNRIFRSVKYIKENEAIETVGIMNQVVNETVSDCRYKLIDKVENLSLLYDDYDEKFRSLMEQIV